MGVDADRVGLRMAAVVLAGGSGTRLGSETNKVYLELDGRPMLAWSLATLDAHPDIVTLVVAVRAGDEPVFLEAMREMALTTPLLTVAGGASRSASERAALELLRPTIEADGLDLVVVHDGARPFVSTELLDRLIAAAQEHRAAVPGLEPDAPVYQTDIGGASATALPTHALRRVQTPQVFAARPLLAAYDLAARAGFDGVDTAEVVARFGDLAAVVVPGSVDNIKVTTPDDLVVARRIAARWRSL